MTTTSPNQEGVEGTECEEVWMITGESVILFTYASFVRNPFILPHQEGIFLGWLARDYTSLRNSWDLQDLLGHNKPETSLIYVHMARDARQLMQNTSL